MALSDYFAPDTLDAPASTDEIAHVSEELGVDLPADLVDFWRTSATFNGQVLTADGEPGPYLRILHPNSAVQASRESKATTPGIVMFGRGEDWDYGVVTGSPARWVDVERESGDILSDLGSSFEEFLGALREEFAAEDDLLG